MRRRSDGGENNPRRYNAIQRARAMQASTRKGAEESLTAEIEAVDIWVKGHAQRTGRIWANKIESPYEPDIIRGPHP